MQATEVTTARAQQDEATTMQHVSSCPLVPHPEIVIMDNALDTGDIKICTGPGQVYTASDASIKQMSSNEIVRLWEVSPP